jgi:hypothetical protein
VSAERRGYSVPPSEGMKLTRPDAVAAVHLIFGGRLLRWGTRGPDVRAS